MKLTTFTLLLLSYYSSAQPIASVSAITERDHNPETNVSIEASITDSRNNKYECGNIIINGYKKIFISKINNDGKPLWKVYGEGDAHYGQSLKFLSNDKEGNLYALGNFSGTMKVDDQSSTAIGASDMVLMKIDGSGKVLWIQQAGGYDYSLAIPRAVTVTKDKMIEVSVETTGPVFFDNKSYNCSKEGRYKALYSAEGKFLKLLPE